MSIDKYFNRRYDSATYNCAHLVCEVWRELKGDDMANALQAMLCAPKKRRAVLSDLRRIKVIDKPQSPCVVFMQAPLMPPHVGVMVRGRVLHITKGRGVQFQPLAVVTAGYKSIRFLTC